MSRRAALIGALVWLLGFSFLPQAVNAAAPHSAAAPALAQAQWPGWQGGYPGYREGSDERRRHCWRMRERLREIRDRIYYAAPWERERLESRIYEIRDRLRQECWGRGWD
jgi:hypothetical protein